MGQLKPFFAIIHVIFYWKTPSPGLATSARLSLECSASRKRRKNITTMQGFFNFFTRSLLITLIVALATSSARHLGENSLTDNNQFLVDSEMNQFEPGMKQWQMELIAQKLAELNSPVGFQRDLRSETERKRRFRACYFNPVSCFKK
ncbi:hypothetical protein JTB14_016219 [Gonioctena quinquepunctata]|nr:hypothetical protein JTB14_016219 [Gonioctena quinquepunctata]